MSELNIWGYLRRYANRKSKLSVFLLFFLRFFLVALGVSFNGAGFEGFDRALPLDFDLECEVDIFNLPPEVFVTPLRFDTFSPSAVPAF